jgi:hypothetical protein
MIEDCQKGCIYGSGLDISLNRLDMRSKFAYTTLSEIAIEEVRNVDQA